MRLPLKSMHQAMSLTLREVQSSAEPLPAERPSPPQSLKGYFKITRVTHLQTDRLHGAITCDEGKCVIPKIRAEGRELLVPVDRLKAQNALSEIRRAAEVVRDKTHVAQLFEVNHSSSPPVRKRHSYWLSSPPFTLAG